MENIRGILGEDFPKSEIDAIIKESDVNKDGRISYFEFLSQWQDQKEEKRQEELFHISNLQKTLSSDESDIASPNSTLSEEDAADLAESDEKDLIGRVNFIEHKQHSERKATSAAKVPVQNPFTQYEDDHCI